MGSRDLILSKISQSEARDGAELTSFAYLASAWRDLDLDLDLDQILNFCDVIKPREIPQILGKSSQFLVPSPTQLAPARASCTQLVPHVPSSCLMYPARASCASCASCASDLLPHVPHVPHVPSSCLMYPARASCASCASCASDLLPHVPHVPHIPQICYLTCLMCLMYPARASCTQLVPHVPHVPHVPQICYLMCLTIEGTFTNRKNIFCTQSRDLILANQIAGMAHTLIYNRLNI